MSFIVAVVASEPLAPAVTWTEFDFGNRLIPTEVARSLLPHFRRWADHVRPIFSQGNVVGLWASSLMTERKWNRLRALAEPLLVPVSEVADIAGEAAPHREREVLALSLSKHGLRIPRTNLGRARAGLASLGDVAVQCEDEWGDGVELLIGPTVSLTGVLLALEIEVDTIEPSSPSKKRDCLGALRAEIRHLDSTLRATA